jgi:hypothetical protein
LKRKENDQSGVRAEREEEARMPPAERELLVRITAEIVANFVRQCAPECTRRECDRHPSTSHIFSRRRDAAHAALTISRRDNADMYYDRVSDEAYRQPQFAGRQHRRADSSRPGACSGFSKLAPALDTLKRQADALEPSCCT